MILTCPECSARYIVDPKALMPSGRVVRCAKCQHNWKEAAPRPDIPIVNTDDAEGLAKEKLPTANKAGSDAAAPTNNDPGNNDPANNNPNGNNPNNNNEEDDFAIKRARRKKRLRPMPKGSNLPALQNHKHGEILWGWYGLGAFVAIIISSFLIFQSTITDVWPPARKLYQALDMESSGLVKKAAHNKDNPVSEIPPEELFKITNTVLNKVRTGQVVTLKVDGNIRNLTDETIPLPLLRISLKGDQGKIIREWTFRSSAATISEDEIVPFSTSLANPPEEATSISVTFARK